MASDKRVVYEKWPKGTLLRVDAELMGGSLLQTLDRQEPRRHAQDQTERRGL
jgi:hypothetical protein